MWTPPSRQQIESNANPYRSLTSEQVRQNAHKAWQEAADKKLKDQYTWDAKKGKYVRLDGKKTPFDDLEDQYTWDEKSGKYVRLDGETGIVEESADLSEGGVKAALEDYMYSIPKAAIEELRPIMKQKASTKKFGQITKILKKHGFTAKFMGSYPANVVNDYFDTFFGTVETSKSRSWTPGGKDDPDNKMGGFWEETNELDEVSPPGWKGTVKAMKKHKDIDNPWALAWWMKGKGYKSHRKEDGTKKESVELGEQEKWIQKAIKKPGSLKKAMGVSPEEEIPTGELNKLIKNLSKKAEGDKTLSDRELKLLQKANLAKTLRGFKKEDTDCGCGEDIEESHTHAELVKLSITKLRELMKEYEEKAAKGDDDAARELADIRGILRSKGAGSVVEENLQERSIADMAAEIIAIKQRGPSMKPKKVTAIKLVLPDTPDIKKKMKAVMDKDAAFRRKMSELVIDREERSNGEIVLHFASFRGREKFSQMMNDAAK